MKKLAKVVAGIIVGLFALLLLLSFTGFEPKDCVEATTLACKAPGLWLRGQPVTTPVTDWSFTTQIPAIKVQTHTPFLIPYSVSAWCSVYNGNLYMTSYRGRRWTEDIIRDPRVRLKIAGKLYDRTITVVQDPAEKAAVLQAKARKYPQWKPPAVSASTVFRVNPE